MIVMAHTNLFLYEPGAWFLFNNLFIICNDIKVKMNPIFIKIDAKEHGRNAGCIKNTDITFFRLKV